MKKYTYTLMAVIIAASTCGALAQRPINGDERRSKMLELFDTDGDGILSDAEREAAKTEMGQRAASTERGPRSGARGPRQGNSGKRQEMLEKFDTDGDGVLSEAEREAARAQMPNKANGKFGRGRGPQDGARRQGNPAKRQEMLEKYDVDGDGILSEYERAEARKDLEGQLNSISE